MSEDLIQHAPHDDLMAVLPGRAVDIARLATLAGGGPPVVTVAGKYNHGKSSLLNELIGAPSFAVSDRRETVSLEGRSHGGAHWLDAPGLDVDVAVEDDRLALQAVWLQSDIRLFVHAAKEGGFDARERAWLEALLADGHASRRQTVVVLSQIDQLADEAAVHDVSNAIAAQLPGIELQLVSSSRHRKGREENKPLLVERSGMRALRARLQAALDAVPAARAHEAARLADSIRGALRERQAGQQAEIACLSGLAAAQRAAFDSGLRAVIAKVAADIEAMLDSLGVDHAIVPDTARDVYGSTAGKRERGKIQIAYSKACIEIDGFLAGHGATELPAAQKTAASSI